jgi:hypothetical protein
VPRRSFSRATTRCRRRRRLYKIFTEEQRGGCKKMLKRIEEAVYTIKYSQRSSGTLYIIIVEVQKHS